MAQRKKPTEPAHTISVRGIDAKVYRKFKAWAKSNGMLLGPAIAAALAKAMEAKNAD